MSLIGFFFAPSGRISRAPYFFGMFSLNVGYRGFEQAITPGPLNIRADFLLAFAFLAAYSAWALTIKRLHDRNRSGWWSILVFGPGLLLSLLFDYGLRGYAMIGLFVLSIGLNIFWLIELVLRVGSAETNNYGAVSDGKI